MSINLIKEKPGSPALFYDNKQQKLILQGKSVAEDPRQFFREAAGKIHTLNVSGTQINNITFRLSYFNTLSAKYLYDLLKDIISSMPEVPIEWEYEEGDEDMLETGQDFEDMLGCDFIFKAI
ncbi:MAG: SiaC family regulatory phosphoprotein [Bacteroidota bacterium]